MLFAGTVANFLDLKTHGTVTFFLFVAGVCYFLYSSPTSEGALECMKVFHWGIFASKNCLCEQTEPLFAPLLTEGKHKCINYAGKKSMKLLRGDSLKGVLKAESGSALLQPVTHKYRSHQPCSLLKIESGPMQKWCYSNTAIILARYKLLGCKEWRCLRQAISFVEGGRRSFVEETAQEQARDWQSEYFHQDPDCSNQSFSQTQSLLGYKKICPEP